MRKKYMPYLGLTLAFFLVGLLCRTPWLADVYPFDWSAFHHDLFLWMGWAVAMLLARSKRYILAWSLPVGNLAGLFLGHYLGDYLYARAQALSAANGNQVFFHYVHYGVLIWLLTVLGFFVIGLVLSWWVKRRHHPAPT